MLGVCQAGKFCPFSHDLDGTLSTDRIPCKYFQNGNCKFGLKYALAHILADGTRVNSRKLQNRRDDDHHRSLAQGNGLSLPSTQTVELSLSDPKSESVFSVSDANASESSLSSLIFPSTTAFLKESKYLESPDYSYKMSVFGQEIWSCHLHNLVNAPPAGFGTSASDISPPHWNINYHDWSHHHTPHSSLPLPGYNYQATFAVENHDDNSAEDACYEDYIPEALGNIIFTPQEKKRRDTRSQSGTLLEQPDISKAVPAGIQKSQSSFSEGDVRVDGGVFVME